MARWFVGTDVLMEGIEENCTSSGIVEVATSKSAGSRRGEGIIQQCLGVISNSEFSNQETYEDLGLKMMWMTKCEEKVVGKRVWKRVHSVCWASSKGEQAPPDRCRTRAGGCATSSAASSQGLLNSVLLAAGPSTRCRRGCAAFGWTAAVVGICLPVALQPLAAPSTKCQRHVQQRRMRCSPLCP